MLFNHCANNNWTRRWSGNALWWGGRCYYIKQFMKMLVEKNLDNYFLQQKKKIFTPMQSHWTPETQTSIFGVIRKLCCSYASKQIIIKNEGIRNYLSINMANTHFCYTKGFNYLCVPNVLSPKRSYHQAISFFTKKQEQKFIMYENAS